jgi:hypothetical protein
MNRHGRGQKGKPRGDVAASWRADEGGEVGSRHRAGKRDGEQRRGQATRVTANGIIIGCRCTLSGAPAAIVDARAGRGVCEGGMQANGSQIGNSRNWKVR